MSTCLWLPFDCVQHLGSVQAQVLLLQETQIYKCDDGSSAALGAVLRGQRCSTRRGPEPALVVKHLLMNFVRSIKMAEKWAMVLVCTLVLSGQVEHQNVLDDINRARVDM